MVLWFRGGLNDQVWTEDERNPVDCKIRTKTKLSVTDVPRGSTKHVRFTEEAAIQDLRERAEKILAIRESEELAEEAVRLGRMVSSSAPLY